MKFSIKDFFSKCDQICNFLRIWLHLLKKSLMENFIFCAIFHHFLSYGTWYFQTRIYLCTAHEIFMKGEFLLILKVGWVNIYRSSRSQMFFKIGVFKDFAIFTRKGRKLYWKETLTQLFSCDYCEIFKNTSFHRTSLVAASVHMHLNKNFDMLFFYFFLKIWTLSSPSSRDEI